MDTHILKFVQKTKWGRRGQKHLYRRINSRPHPLFFISVENEENGGKIKLGKYTFFLLKRKPASFSFNERKSSARRAKSGRSIKRHFDWSSTAERNGTERAVASAVSWLGGIIYFSQQQHHPQYPCTSLYSRLNISVCSVKLSRLII